MALVVLTKRQVIPGFGKVPSYLEYDMRLTGYENQLSPVVLSHYIAIRHTASERGALSFPLSSS
jgi:hypothetical protein